MTPGVATDLVTSAAGTHDGTEWLESDGLRPVDLHGAYEVTLLDFAASALRDWSLDIDVQEIERRTIGSLAGTRIGNPANRWQSIASREPSVTRLGSAFRPISELAGRAIGNVRRPIGGDRGSVGRNTLCRVLVAWIDGGGELSAFEAWEPQTRDARGMRLRLELWRLSSDFELSVNLLTAVATAVPSSAPTSE